MKKIRLLSYFLFLVLINASACKEDSDEVQPDPVAAFTQDKTILVAHEANKTVTFTNTSAHATRYEWDFGNGHTSTLANPVAVFDSSGTYTIKLTAYNDQNISSSQTGTVKVGSLYFTKGKVNSIIYNINGYPWDVTTTYDPNNIYNHPHNYPDGFLIFSWAGRYSAHGVTPVMPDITPAMLPLNLTFQSPEKIGKDGPMLMFFDSDSTNAALMGDWWVNSTKLYAQWNKQAGEFTYKPETGSSTPWSDVELTCEFRAN